MKFLTISFMLGLLAVMGAAVPVDVLETRTESASAAVYSGTCSTSTDECTYSPSKSGPVAICHCNNKCSTNNGGCSYRTEPSLCHCS